MKLMNQARRYGAKVACAAAGAILAVPAFASGGNESGIDTADVLAVLADGKAKGIIIGVAMLGVVVVFGMLRRTRGVAK
jgi:hypothetical protein